jgi:hypothetical protein
MAKIIAEQKNTWGSTGERSPNAQRTDLWAVSLKSVVDGLNNQIYQQGESVGLPLLDPVATYFAQSVALPELKVNADKFYRGSKPYMMPVYDEPIQAARIMFIVESPVKSKVSRIYSLLDTWRAFVRAGRGRMSTEGVNITLGTNFRIDYAFPIRLTLLRGEHDLDFYTPTDSSNKLAGDRTELATELSPLPQDQRNKRIQQIMEAESQLELPTASTDLQVSGEYELDKAWLSSFKMSELDYKQGNSFVTLEAMIFAENIRDVTTSKSSARGALSQ